MEQRNICPRIYYHSSVKRDIVLKAKGTTRALALEDLKGIRSRATVRHEQRDRHSKWAFAQLRGFIEYKAKREGIHSFVVDPKKQFRRIHRVPRSR